MEQMDCNVLVELVTDSLEESLDTPSLLQMLDHLQVCKGCDDYFDEVLVTLKAISKSPPPPLSADLKDRLLAIYREWAESRVVA